MGYVFVALTDVANCPSLGLYHFILPSAIYEGPIFPHPQSMFSTFWILSNLIDERWSPCLYLRPEKSFPRATPTDFSQVNRPIQFSIHTFPLSGTLFPQAYQGYILISQSSAQMSPPTRSLSDQI